MKNLSSLICRRLVRHLSTTATGTTPISIHKAKQMLQKEHDPDKALEIYSSFPSHFAVLFPDRYAAEVTVQRLADARRFDDIVTLIESLKNDPKITQEPYFCHLIRLYGNAGMFDHAIKLYEQMEELGTPRSCDSFSSLLVAGYNSRVFDRVRQVFDEIPERYGFDPDEFSYVILFRACCEMGEPEMGLKIIEEMEGKRVKFTAGTLTTVLDALYKAGKVAEAEKVYDVVGKCTLRLSRPAFAALILYLCEKEEYAKGYDVFKISEHYFQVPNFDDVKVLVEGLVKKNMREDAKALIRTMKKPPWRRPWDYWEKFEVGLGLANEEGSADGNVPAV